MSPAVLAESRYRVQFGELTVGERMLDALTVTGFDAFGIAPMGPPGFTLLTRVVEVVSRQGGRVVYRRRDADETSTALFDELALDLVRLTADEFEARWSIT
jgi:hypothetical protein